MALLRDNGEGDVDDFKMGTCWHVPWTSLAGASLLVIYSHPPLVSHLLCTRPTSFILDNEPSDMKAWGSTDEDRRHAIHR